MLSGPAGLHRSPDGAGTLWVVTLRFALRRVAPQGPEPPLESVQPAAALAAGALRLPPAMDPPMLPPRPEPPPPPPAQDGEAGMPRVASGWGPFAGGFRVATWNAQGLFAECPAARRAKRLRVRRLLADHDVVIVTETHSTPEAAALHTVAGRTVFEGCPAFWAHGTPASAGVGVIVQPEFLRRFGEQVGWRVLVPGRAAEWWGSGAEGDISVFAVYFATGAGGGVGAADVAASAREARSDMRRVVAARVAPADQRLSIVMGDFNWVADDMGRVSSAGLQPSGSRDRGEERHWAQLLQASRLTLWRHPAYTHQHQGILSRLDRCYCNLHPSCFLDERVGVAVADWARRGSASGPLLSTHRPVSVYRCPREPADGVGPGRRYPAELSRNPAWSARTRLLFAAKLQASSAGLAATALGRLRLLKEAMAEAAQGLLRAAPREVAPTDAEGRLAWAMRGLRGLREGDRHLLRKAAVAVPTLEPCLRLPEAAAEAFLRAAAVEGAREVATAALESVRAAWVVDAPPEELRQRRNRAMLALRRLRPRAEGALSAVQLPEGEVTTDLQRAAPALSRHWAEHFRSRGVPGLDRSDAWWAGVPSFADAMPEFAVTTDHLRRALRAAGNTAPGPDGIPYAFWRGVGDLGLGVLEDALRELMLEGSDVALARSYGSSDSRFGVCDFNASLLVLLPKKPAGVDPVAGDYHAPEDTRPLMLVDTSNRLLASALRYAVEPGIARMIGPGQRGFLSGRSIVESVVGLEAAMQTAALDGEGAYALLFDFRAAFPSLEPAYLHRALERLAFPPGFRAAVRALYAEQYCCLSLAGRWWEGFRVTSGIRQGCPLSPLLFVMVLEGFSQQLDAVAGVRMRLAFADDLAVVGTKGAEAWPALRRLFGDLGAAAGLHLNLAKTVLLPLWTWEVGAAAGAWRAAVPGWEGVRVAHSGTYLGFEVGPEAADTGWARPVRRFREAVLQWAGAAPGLHLSILAYNVYALPKLQYVAQLLGTPPGWVALEKWAVQRMFPGPAGWLPPGVAQALRDQLRFPSQLQSLATAGPAAQLRVGARGGDFHRRLPLRQWETRLADARRASSAWDIIWRWDHWFRSGPVQRLLAARQGLADEGINERGVLDAGLRGQPRPVTLRVWRRAQAALQSTAAMLLRRRLWAGVGHAQFDAKLRRWRDHHSLPGRRAHRCQLVMQRLPKRTPPRVRAALLRTWLNGWCTQRRFGVRGTHCLFGCRLGEDDVRHYVACPRLWRFGCRRLGLADPGEASLRANRALLWHSPASTADLAATATLIAVGYKAHTLLRRARPGSLEPGRLFEECLAQLRAGVEQ